MTLVQVLKRIESMKRAERKKQLAQAKSYRRRAKRKGSEYLAGYAADCQKRAENPQPFSLPWRPRLKLFKTDARCTFDPVSEEAHSYSWYLLAARIKGVMVLNTYAYSKQTTQHVGTIRRLLEQLGIKYMEIEAPRGLDNLSLAASRAAELYGQAYVRAKYARDKEATVWTPQGWARGSTYADRLIKNLASIGVKVTQKQLKAAIFEAEQDRTARLKRQREKSRLNRFPFVQVANSQEALPTDLVVNVYRHDAERFLAAGSKRYAAEAIDAGKTRVALVVVPDPWEKQAPQLEVVPSVPTLRLITAEEVS